MVLAASPALPPPRPPQHPGAMLLVQKSPDTAAANLAVDEWLFRAAEADQLGDDILRWWEPVQFAVVLGRGSRIDREVDVDRCRQDHVQIVRRTSGGAAVVTGPGCLMYSLVLHVDHHADRRGIPDTHCWVLSQVARAMRNQGQDVRFAGTSDLAVETPAGLKKCSGNSLRVGRRTMLYHGTLLFAFPLDRIGQWLRHPPREPDYRVSRAHEDFLTCLSLRRDQLEQALLAAFPVSGHWSRFNAKQVQALLAAQFENAAWTFRH